MCIDVPDDRFRGIRTDKRVVFTFGTLKRIVHNDRSLWSTTSRRRYCFNNNLIDQRFNNLTACPEGRRAASDDFHSKIVEQLFRSLKLFGHIILTINQ